MYYAYRTSITFSLFFYQKKLAFNYFFYIYILSN